MDKYQEALEILDRFAYGDNAHTTNLIVNSVKTLQELIDNYSKISQFDKAIFFNSKNLVVNGISYEQLEKALDKACEELDDRYYCHKGIRIACDDENCKMCIKEYLLEESEKQ